MGENFKRELLSENLFTAVMKLEIWLWKFYPKVFTWDGITFYPPLVRVVHHQHFLSR
jgi:hypothetical protein